ncbi:MAG: hypothetical protein ACKOW9_03460 [Candidatus Paceibacterota bacterium]
MSVERISSSRFRLFNGIFLFCGPVLSLHAVSVLVEHEYRDIYMLAVFLIWMPFGLGIPDLVLQSRYDLFLEDRRGGMAGNLFFNKAMFYRFMASSKQGFEVAGMISGLILAAYINYTSLSSALSLLS